ncbi:MAG: 3'-5' exonuclease [Gemmatimonadetes bacterium]|nr:3'-5' exonuclease [Gemmatimonadota bacterium]
MISQVTNGFGGVGSGGTPGGADNRRPCGGMSSRPLALHDAWTGDGTPHATVDFAVVDIETTGTGAVGADRVTEVAAVRVRGSECRLLFHSLVNPGRPIPAHITRLTGIHDAMVSGAPRFADIAGALAAELAGRVFVAHNARFDWRFLDAEFRRLGAPALEGVVAGRLCTVQLARRVLRHLPRRNLDAVCHHYGIENDGRHRAAGDAQATAQVLVRLLRDADRAGWWSLESLGRALVNPRRRARGRSGLPTSSEGADGA